MSKKKIFKMCQLNSAPVSKPGSPSVDSWAESPTQQLSSLPGWFGFLQGALPPVPAHKRTDALPVCTPSSQGCRGKGGAALSSRADSLAGQLSTLSLTKPSP